MNLARVSAWCVGWLALAVVDASAKATWPIEVDGERVEVSWLSLSDTPDRLAEGDVLYVGVEGGGMLVCVRDTENLCFVNRLRSEAILYRKTEDGLVPVGFSTQYWTSPEEQRDEQEDDEDPEKEIEDPPPPSIDVLEPAAISGLWGVAVDSGEDARLMLTHVDRLRTFCALNNTDWMKDAPLLPPGPYRCLSLNWSGEPTDELYALISPETEALLLSVYNNRQSTLDCRRVAVADRLRVLKLQVDACDDFAPLAACTALRTLMLPYGIEISEFAWTARLRALREIDMDGVAVSSIAPLAELPELRVILAVGSGVSELPRDGFATLRELQIVGAPVPREQVAAFRSAHPQCRVDFEWKLAFVGAVETADRLVVRSGGTCHRDPESEHVLAEVTTREEVAAFLDMIEIDEEQSNGVCMCCGTPTLEFYAGSTFLEMVGIQHGQALRWRAWPADATLTPASRGALARWLSARGVGGPQEELDEETRRTRAQERDQKRFTEALGPLLAVGLDSMVLNSWDDFIPVVRRVHRGESEQATIYLRLLGATPEASWNQGAPGGARQAFAGAFQALPAIVRADALRDAATTNDLRVRAGASRILFNEGGWREIDEKVLAEFVPQFARWAACSPRLVNRVRTMRSLEQMPAGASREILVEIALGDFSPRVLAPEDEAEPGGMVEFAVGDSDVPESASIAEHAVLCLARLNDPRARELFARLEACAGTRDADVRARVAARLENPDAPPEEEVRVPAPPPSRAPVAP